MPDNFEMTTEEGHVIWVSLEKPAPSGKINFGIGHDGGFLTPSEARRFVEALLRAAQLVEPSKE